MQKSRIVIAVAVMALLAAGCTQSAQVNTDAGQGENINATANVNTETSVNANTSAVTGQTKTFEVKGDNFKYDPSEIRVKEGDTVVINFTNTGGFHDWVLDEFNARTKQLADGGKETVTFVASKKGTFEYYCSVGQHRQMGMKGNLIVE
jgi:plastocyanin